MSTLITAIMTVLQLAVFAIVEVKGGYDLRLATRAISLLFSSTKYRLISNSISPLHFMPRGTKNRRSCFSLLLDLILENGLLLSWRLVLLLLPLRLLVLLLLLGWLLLNTLLLNDRLRLGWDGLLLLLLLLNLDGLLLWFRSLVVLLLLLNRLLLLDNLLLLLLDRWLHDGRWWLVHRLRSR